MSVYDEVDRDYDKTRYPQEHYNGWKVGAFITELDLSFYEGNVIKYLCRYKKKDGMKDLLKARDYLNKVIEDYEHNSKRT